MKRNLKTKWFLTLFSGVVLVVAANASPVQAKIDLSKPLDTRKGLYVRKTGTPVYKDVKRTGTRVYTYRRRDGVLVRTFVRPNGSKSRTYTRAPRRLPMRRTRR